MFFFEISLIYLIIDYGEFSLGFILETTSTVELMRFLKSEGNSSESLLATSSKVDAFNDNFSITTKILALKPFFRSLATARLLIISSSELFLSRSPSESIYLN